MKINGSNGLNINPYQKQLEQQQIKQEGTKKRDQVEISSQAKELQVSGRFATERQEKVKALQQQVDSGNYKVNPEEVAKKFHEFWRH